MQDTSHSQYRCAVCESTKHSQVLASVGQSRFAVTRCSACGLEFLDPQPTWSEIETIYTSEYYRSWDMSDGEKRPVAEMKKLTFQLRMEEIISQRSAGKILDIGTASGFFLEVARDFGFDPYGIEVSKYAGGIAALKFGADHIHIGTLETAPFAPGMFDVITMSDLIEHVQDPVATLTQTYRLLKQDGWVMIVTPDTGSFSRRLMGARWTHYKLEHLFYFNHESMRIAAEKSGFQVVMAKPAVKAITLKYMRDQLQVYPHPVLTPLASVGASVLKPMIENPIRITIGEVLFFLRKKKTLSPGS